MCSGHGGTCLYPALLLMFHDNNYCVVILCTVECQSSVRRAVNWDFVSCNHTLILRVNNVQLVSYNSMFSYRKKVGCPSISLPKLKFPPSRDLQTLLCIRSHPNSIGSPHLVISKTLILYETLHYCVMCLFIHSSPHTNVKYIIE